MKSRITTLALLLSILGLTPLLGKTTEGASDNITRQRQQYEAGLRRLGKVATAAEAAPLLKELAADQEAHFQARRAARLKMKGKSEAEKLTIWAAMLAAEKPRCERMRELEYKTDVIRKEQWEKVRTTNKKGGGK